MTSVTDRVRALRDTAMSLFLLIEQHTLPGEGITRPSYSDEETHAMEEVAAAARTIGASVTWDFAGNLHATLAGTGLEIAMGSHVDSVPSGGRYDGVAGVVAALLVLQLVSAEPVDTRPALRLIIYRGEESAWYGKCYLGSLALFGKLTVKDLDLRYRQTGAPLAAMIEVCGGHSGRVAAGERVLEPATIGRFFEVHIEQGPELVHHKHPVGLVTSIAGNHRYLKARAVGTAGHSGTTPMALREDAVMGFARFLSSIENGRMPELVLTSGIVHTDATKNSVSCIADEVKFCLEYRGSDSEDLRLFGEFVERRALAYGISLGPRLETAPVGLDRNVLHKTLMPAVRETAGLDVHFMMSGAGHDAAVFQQMGIPTGMIFIRNDHGSHNPDEAMEIDDFLLATEVLYRAVMTPIKEQL